MMTMLSRAETASWAEPLQGPVDDDDDDDDDAMLDDDDDAMMTMLSRASNQLFEDISQTEKERTEERRAKRITGETCRLRSAAETHRLRSAAAQSYYCCGASPPGTAS